MVLCFEHNLIHRNTNINTQNRNKNSRIGIPASTRKCAVALPRSRIVPTHFALSCCYPLLARIRKRHRSRVLISLWPKRSGKRHGNHHHIRKRAIDTHLVRVAGLSEQVSFCVYHPCCKIVLMVSGGNLVLDEMDAALTRKVNVRVYRRGIGKSEVRVLRRTYWHITTQTVGLQPPHPPLSILPAK